MVLVGRLREASQRQNPATHSSRTPATLRDTLLPKLLSVELGSIRNIPQKYTDKTYEHLFRLGVPREPI